MCKLAALITGVILAVGFLTPVLAEGPAVDWTWGWTEYLKNGHWAFHCDGTGEEKCALNIEHPETALCSVPVDSLPGFIEEDEDNYYFTAMVLSNGTIVNDEEGTILMVLPIAAYEAYFCPGE